MTKKNFIAAALLINNMTMRKEFCNVRERELVISSFIQLFKSNNPNFDEKRFRDACKCTIID